MQTLSETKASIITKSKQLLQQAQQVIPGGVNSPVRAFGAVGGTPRFIQAAKGAYLTDVDQQQYIDYVGSWGPMILGHAHPEVIKAVSIALAQGLSFGAPCPLEVELAEAICQRIPSIDQIRFVNSGTEATMSAIRLARAATGRDKIIKFIGCYHGHADCLLVEAGSGALTFGQPSSPGVPNGTTTNTLLAEFNNLDSVNALFEQHGDSIAGIIVEPIAGNMNLIMPKANFLPGLRQLCDHYQSLLIFDEVMTGFRVGPQGAQGLYNITPDLSTFGKVIGGGMPVGAFGGRHDIMQQLSPQGSVYQAGTLSGNPLAMAAGLATLKQLKAEHYTQLAQFNQQLTTGLEQLAQSANIPLLTQYCGGMFGFFFTKEKNIHYFDQVMACNEPQFKQFFNAMLQQQIYLAPSRFESNFSSIAHTEKEMRQTLSAAEQAFENLNKKM